MYSYQTLVVVVRLEQRTQDVSRDQGHTESISKARDLQDTIVVPNQTLREFIMQCTYMR